MKLFNVFFSTRKRSALKIGKFSARSKLFGEPPADKNRKPLTLKEILSIVVAGHIGVRKRTQRVEDFQRANGLSIFFAAAIYFIIIVVGIVMLVRTIAA